MSVITRGKVLEAFRYYIDNGGYYEKANNKNLTREVSDFAKNKGSANYTYMGKLCGVTPAPWCAQMVSTAVLEACGGDKEMAKQLMWGLWPHHNCGTIADMAAAKGLFHWSWYGLHKMRKKGAVYTPRPGDVIVFTDAWKTRDHTGIVYAVDESCVYTYEGNSGQMARKRSYPLTSGYIYGYCSLVLPDGEPEEVQGPVAELQRWLDVTADGEYGPETKMAALCRHQHCIQAEEDGEWGPETYYATQTLRPGDEGDDVALWQGLLYCKGFDPIGMDGEYGDNTMAATVAFQASVGLNPSGLADRYTWAKMFDEGRPEHNSLKKGDKGAEVLYMQKLLWDRGYSLDTDGEFGEKTEDDLKDFQKAEGLEVDGVCGPKTWEVLE